MFSIFSAPVTGMIYCLPYLSHVFLARRICPVCCKGAMLLEGLTPNIKMSFKTKNIGDLSSSHISLARHFATGHSQKVSH